MEYERLPDGSSVALRQRNVDTGMGLARTLAVLNGVDSVYDTDMMQPLIEIVGQLSGRDYQSNQQSFRIIADHVQSACHVIADGVVPSNVEQGYVLRRLIRRLVVHAWRLGIEGGIWEPLLAAVRRSYGEVYPDLNERAGEIAQLLDEEEHQFERTLKQGLRQFQRQAGDMEEGGMIDGHAAFDLFATYGFPIEMTVELAMERGLSVDTVGYGQEYERHQQLSRQGAERKFAGGLADHSEMATRYHTATHLLHAALRKVLGEHVEQRGSNITNERLRFDFSHPEKVDPDQLKSVEALVNGVIAQDYPVPWEETTVEQAREGGALGLFGEKYGGKVKVYAIGDLAGRPDAYDGSTTFSKEICGGPHVERTGLLGRFRIVKEQSASRGVRRIRAVLED